MTTYLGIDGTRVSAREYYTQLAAVAQARQQTFRRFSAARRRWRRHEQEYLRAVQRCS